MAKVTIGRLGSTMKEVEASTVKEALAQYDSSLEGTYKVQVNGQEASMEDSLNGGEFISIGEKVKGGNL